MIDRMNSSSKNELMIWWMHQMNEWMDGWMDERGCDWLSDWTVEVKYLATPPEPPTEK